MCRQTSHENALKSLAKVAGLALLIGLGAVLVASTAQAQVWTGEELLTSGDWVEMSYADGPNGPRTYSVVGTSLRWEPGFRAECVGNGGPGGRCVAERTFRLPVPAGCVGPFTVSYHFTRESADNDFLVGIGNSSLMVQTTTSVNQPMRISRSSFSGLGDPAYNGFAILESGDPITPPVGGEVWVEATYDMSSGFGLFVDAAGSSTSHPSPTTISTGTSPLGEPLYLFLATGDRDEQILFHSVALDGCDVEGLIEDLIDLIESMDLNSGQESALVQALDHALRELDEGDTAKASKFLGDLRKKVEKWRGKQIPEDDADLILTAVDSISALLESS